MIASRLHYPRYRGLFYIYLGVSSFSWFLLGGNPRMKCGGDVDLARGIGGRK